MAFWFDSLDKNSSRLGFDINSHSTKIAGIFVTLSTGKFASFTPLSLGPESDEIKLFRTGSATFYTELESGYIHVSIPSAVEEPAELLGILINIGLWTKGDELPNSVIIY